MRGHMHACLITQWTTPMKMTKWSIFGEDITDSDTIAFTKLMVHPFYIRFTFDRFGESMLHHKVYF